jgi:5-methylcytosine-specific restriction endonuclease McrA
MGTRTLATDVDHVTPIREAPGRRLDPENLQPLCKSCHSVKTGKEKAGKRDIITTGVDGLPVGSGHDWSEK